MLFNFLTYVRFKDWYKPILFPIFSFYLIGLSQNNVQIQNVKQTFISLFFFFGLSFFTAAFGFFLNEWTDEEDDKLAGKNNVVESLSISQRWFMLLGIVIAILVCIYGLKWNKLTALILTFQFLFLILYSVQPFRLKRQPYLAIFLDALYSGTLFYLLAIIIGSNYKVCDVYFLIFIGSWGFIKGIRNILLHLLADKQFDVKLDFKTIATNTKNKQLIQLIQYIIIPIEVLLFCFVLSFLDYPYIWISIYLLYVLYMFFRKDYIVPFIIKRKNKIPTNMLAELNYFYERIMLVLLLVMYFYLVIF